MVTDRGRARLALDAGLPIAVLYLLPSPPEARSQKWWLVGGEINTQS